MHQGTSNCSQQTRRSILQRHVSFSVKEAWVLALPLLKSEQPCCDSTALSKPLCGPVSLSAAWIIMLLILVGVAFIFLAVIVHKRKIQIFAASLRHHRLLKPIQITTILPAATAIGNLLPGSWECCAHGRSLLLFHTLIDANKAIPINEIILSLFFFFF